MEEWSGVSPTPLWGCRPFQGLRPTHLRNSLITAYEYVQSHMGHKQQRQQDCYNSKTHGNAFMADKHMWVHNPEVPRGKSKKLHRPWTGPFRVLKRLVESVYRLQYTRSWRKHVIEALLPQSVTTHASQGKRNSTLAVISSLF